MTVFRTSKLHPVTHSCHKGEVACAKKPLVAANIAAFVASLGTVFPTAVKVGEPDGEFNCHGFSFADSHGFFFDPTLFISDDHFEVPLSQPRIDDVLVYINGILQAHSARVIEVNDNQITRVRSKWGSMGLVEHAPDDVSPDYGPPTRLFRRNVVGETHVFLTESLVMEEVDKQAAIDEAVTKFIDPSVQYRVMLASSPEVAKLIIERLPGVQELLALGSEVAGKAAVELLNKEETQENEALSGIALHILEMASHEETAPDLARAVRENKFSGINQHLAADALLSAAKAEPLTTDKIKAAKVIAEEFK